MHFLAHYAVAVALSVLAMLPVQSANAGIKTCRLADGTVVFQDTACAVVPTTQSKTKVKTKTAPIPFGIDESWFSKPPIQPDRAICTKTDCHCGMFSRRFKGGLPIAIADALYLDGSWHRLDSTVMQLEKDDLSSIDRSDLRRERDEAACNILMSQKMLRQFGPDVLRDLRNKKRYAEDRGLDNPADCDAGDEIACTYTDLITLYDRIQVEIKALSSRSRLASDDDDLFATSDN